MDENNNLVINKADCANHGYILTEKCLGSGGFAKVMLAYATPEKIENDSFLAHALSANKKKSVAIKVINMAAEKHVNKDMRKLVSREIECLTSVRGSKHIVQLFETFECENFVYIILEYAPNGDLINFTRSDRYDGLEMAEEKARLIFKEIAEGLQELHQNNIIHKDLKPDNILVTKNNTLKISDFGLAQKVSTDRTLREFAGSRRYMSPEAIRKEPADAYINDIWGLGCILFFLLFGRHPGPSKGIRVGKQTLLEAAEVAPVATLERSTLSQDCVDLVYKILTVDWKNRPGIDSILNHPWLQKEAKEEKKDKSNKKRKYHLDGVDEMAPELKMFKYDMATPPPVAMVDPPKDNQETKRVFNEIFGTSSNVSSTTVNPPQEVINQYAYNRYDYPTIGKKRSATAVEETPVAEVPAVKRVIISIGGTTSSHSSDYTDYTASNDAYR